MEAGNLITDELILTKIYMIRGQKVMVDFDLAELFNVETRVFNQAVKRNSARFPEDFCFQLTAEEYDSLRSQFVILKRGRGQHPKFLPYVFTEQGVAMLSSILNSDLAIKVHIQIIRLFTRLRELILNHNEILLKMEEIEKRIGGTEEDIQMIFGYLKQLLHTPNPPRQQIGFKPDN
jgi:hypothetical protein